LHALSRAEIGLKDRMPNMKCIAGVLLDPRKKNHPNIFTKVLTDRFINHFTRGETTNSAFGAARSMCQDFTKDLMAPYPIKHFNFAMWN
jgi:hypothetical protein